MYYKVIDDFLPEQNLISLYNSILSNKVKWSFSDSVASRSDTSGFYFNSVFFELINFSLKTEQVLLSMQNDFPFNELSILKKSSFS